MWKEATRCKKSHFLFFFRPHSPEPREVSLVDDPSLFSAALKIYLTKDKKKKKKAWLEEKHSDEEMCIFVPQERKKKIKDPANVMWDCCTIYMYGSKVWGHYMFFKENSFIQHK